MSVKYLECWARNQWLKRILKCKFEYAMTIIHERFKEYEWSLSLGVRGRVGSEIDTLANSNAKFSRVIRCLCFVRNSQLGVFPTSAKRFFWIINYELVCRFFQGPFCRFYFILKMQVIFIKKKSNRSRFKIYLWHKFKFIQKLILISQYSHIK